MAGLNIDVGVVDGVTGLIETGLDLFAGDDKRRALLVLEQLKAAKEQNVAQATVNANEAKHANIFISGWRPAIGWCCALALAFTYIVKPYVFPFLYAYYPSLAALPPVDEGLFELVLGMLGLAGLRTFEKRNGLTS